MTQRTRPTTAANHLDLGLISADAVDLRALADQFTGSPRKLRPLPRRWGTALLMATLVLALLLWMAHDIGLGKPGVGGSIVFLIQMPRFFKGLWDSLTSTERPGRPSRRVPTEALRGFVVAAQRAPASEAVGPILDVVACAGLFTGNERGTMRSVLHDTLERLLPRLTVDQARALTDAQRDTLRQMVAQRHAGLTVPALLVLASAGDVAALPDALWLAGNADEVRWKEAAAECVAGARFPTTPAPETLARTLLTTTPDAFGAPETLAAACPPDQLLAAVADALSPRWQALRWLRGDAALRRAAAVAACGTDDPAHAATLAALLARPGNTPTVRRAYEMALARLLHSALPDPKLARRVQRLAQRKEAYASFCDAALTYATRCKRVARP